MAAAQLSLTRRALLGAACAPLALPRHPGLDPGSTFFAAVGSERWTSDQVRGDGEAQSPAVTKWDRALVRFQKAEAALDAAADGPEEIYDRLGARHDTALVRLLRTPAPTVAALAVKLGLALYERAVEFVGDAAAMRILKQDARRLALRSS